jgi:hypothetical protein
MENKDIVEPGDKIEITNPDLTFSDYDIGTRMVVMNKDKDGVYVKQYSDNPAATNFIFHNEYKIIEKKSQNLVNS